MIAKTFLWRSTEKSSRSWKLGQVRDREQAGRRVAGQRSILAVGEQADGQRGWRMAAAAPTRAQSRAARSTARATAKVMLAVAGDCPPLREITARASPAPARGMVP